MPAGASAAPVDQIAPTPSASGGPSTNVTSSTVDSNANSAGSRLGSVTIAGSSVRTQADSGGVAIPAAAASADQRRRRRARRREPGGDEHERGDGRAADEHRGLAAAVDEPSEQRAPRPRRRSRRRR